MPKHTTTQLGLDLGTSALPLFSGTPVQVHVGRAAPRRVVEPAPAAPRARQASYASCRVCFDSGTVEVRAGHTRQPLRVACTCPAGVAELLHVPCRR